MPITIIVPCYNEAARFSISTFSPLLRNPDVFLLFVNDGSRDKTLSLLDEAAQSLGVRARVLSLRKNCGKAEAVRAGLLSAIASGAETVGFLDADGATPATEMLRLVEFLAVRNLDVALATRIGLLGTQIERSPMRHYIGRVFSSIAAPLLAVRIYDTQCGAKLFRATPLLEDVLTRPFVSRWLFDIELLGRLLRGARSHPPLDHARIAEMPLQQWRDVEGSKLTLWDGPLILLDLMKVKRSLDEFVS